MIEHWSGSAGFDEGRKVVCRAHPQLAWLPNSRTHALPVTVVGQEGPGPLNHERTDVVVFNICMALVTPTKGH